VAHACNLSCGNAWVLKSLKGGAWGLGEVVNACNYIYSERRGQEDCGLRPI
jgi:hypothetical protein